MNRPVIHIDIFAPVNVFVRPFNERTKKTVGIIAIL
jgi:hypothetical protein